MKINYVFEVPYIIRTGSNSNKYIVNHNGLKGLIEIHNPSKFEYKPWLSVTHKSAVSGQIFSHYDEAFRVDSEKNHSTIKISITIGRKTLDALPKTTLGPFLAWKKSLIEGNIVGKILDLLFNRVMKLYDRFIEVYTYTTKEIYNNSYIEPIFQKSFPYGVKVYVDDVFVGQYHFIQGTSLIILSDDKEKDMKIYLEKDVEIDVVQNLMFQSQVNFFRKKYKFSLLTLAQSVEIFIDNYLSRYDGFSIDENGSTSYSFSGNNQRVNNQRKFIDVLKEVKGVTIFDYNENVWDNLDQIIQIRHQIIHKNKTAYKESKKHKELRKHIDETYLEFYVDLSKELPRYINAVHNIIEWISSL